MIKDTQLFTSSSALNFDNKSGFHSILIFQSIKSVICFFS